MELLRRLTTRAAAFLKTSRKRCLRLCGKLRKSWRRPVRVLDRYCRQVRRGPTVPRRGPPDNLRGWYITMTQQSTDVGTERTKAPLNPDRIPEVLKERPQWVNWRYERREEK